MRRIPVFLFIVVLTLAACSPGILPTSGSRPASAPAPEQTPPTSAPALPIPNLSPSGGGDTEVRAYVTFSINVQDFSYPDLSAALLTKILDLHESTGVPVDIYLTDQMAQIFADDSPALLERLRTSPVVAVSYHTRSPRPYASDPDWLGLDALSPDDLYATILDYETHLVDPVTGEPTEASGGYAGVAALIGYPPYAASALSGNPDVRAAAIRVFADLGAQMTLTHGKSLKLGDTQNGLPVRPEQVDYRLFEMVGEEAGTAFESALAQAQASGDSPAFVGVKMHDNNFFATASAWTTVYVQDRRRPPWNPDLKADLLSPAEQDAVWALYEATVRYVAAHPEAVTAVNLPDVLAMLP